MSSQGRGYGYTRNWPEPLQQGEGSAGPAEGHTSRNFTYPLRPTQATIGPAWNAPRDDNRGTARRAAPPMPPMSRSGNRIGLPRSPRPPAQGPSYAETISQPTLAYRSGQHPLRPQPRYAEPDQVDPASCPSTQSDRSIHIGYNPSPEFGENLPSSPPALASNQQRRGTSGTAPPPPSSRRAASSYYSQQTVQVSPIPEEPSLSRHDSYASSAAIPTSWDPDESYSSSSNESITRLPIEGTGEQGLVRQASLGRKTKPTLTEIKNPDRSRSRRGSKSAEPDSNSTSPIATPRRTSPVHQILQNMSSGSSPMLTPTPSRSPGPPKSPLSQPPLAATDGTYSGKPPIYRKQSDMMSLEQAKELGIAVAALESASQTGTRRSSATSSRIPGRRLPPRLNIDAVREAEARGSLTSLPDLIRRATKLAAALETGRPGSLAWGRRNSMFDQSSGRAGGGRDTDSISDILASFPPPANSRNGTGGQQRTMSQWFLPDEYGAGHVDDSGSIRQARTGRRICGLPLWAFIVLVLLALVVITAAVIVPLQLVSTSKADNVGSDESGQVSRCRESNPCQNGGENIATSSFCGCICTNGFTGASCAEKDADLSCTSFDFQDRQGNGSTIVGIKNATIGSALPRLFAKADDAYNIHLDPSLVLGVFSKGNLSCTLQNALVNFTGRATPQTQSRMKKREFGRRQINTDPAPSPILTTSLSPTPSRASQTPSPTLTGTRNSALDQDAVDFARVAVLYVVQTENLDTAESARQGLDNTFRKGVDFGNVTTSGKITFQLDDRSIVLADGDVVGGVNR